MEAPLINIREIEAKGFTTLHAAIRSETRSGEREPLWSGRGWALLFVPIPSSLDPMLLPRLYSIGLRLSAIP
ncbi:hypothetical protein CHU98_g6641 [Xylaria longipes]|nr:hypothetical protein CHU98_g6641 [Xylaria longipes]